MENYADLPQPEGYAALPVVLDPAATHFQTSRHRYTVLRDVTRLPVCRYREFERFSLEIGFSASFEFIDAQLTSAMKYLSSGQSGVNMAFTILYNLKQGALDMDSKYIPTLALASLFIVRHDESWSTYDPAIAAEKMADWDEIDSGFFLGLQAHILSGFTAIWNSTSQESFAPVSPRFQQARASSLEPGSDKT